MQARLWAEASQTYRAPTPPPPPARLLPALLWPPASASRLQWRQSYLPKPKQAEKHKTASPSVFLVFTWCGDSLPRALALFWDYIRISCSAAVSQTHGRLHLGGRHAPLRAERTGPSCRQDKDGDRAQRSGGDRRGGLLAWARLSVTSGLASAHSLWNLFIINHGSEAEGKHWTWLHVWVRPHFLPFSPSLTSSPPLTVYFWLLHPRSCTMPSSPPPCPFKYSLYFTLFAFHYLHFSLSSFCF